MCSRFHCSFLFSLVFMTALGCGPAGPEMGQVTGKVTFDGVVIPTGTIQFWPESGRPSRGSIADDGTYTLTTFEKNDGALVGKHRVTIQATQISEQGPQLDSTAAEIAHFSQKGAKRIRASRVKWLVPEEYSEVDTTTLVATVKPESNSINFEIEKE